LSEQRTSLQSTSAVPLSSLMGGGQGTTGLAEELEKVESKRKTLLAKVRRIREKRARVSLSSAVDESTWKALSLEACPDPNKKNRVWVFAAELLEETGQSNKQPYVNVVYGPSQSKTMVAKLQWMQKK
ncbi:unnamed protein product, partial [Symbiodinium microadriaticum]